MLWPAIAITASLAAVLALLGAFFIGRALSDALARLEGYERRALRTNRVAL